jgi:hypothetical protein
LSSREDLPTCRFDFNKQEDSCGMTEEKIPLVCPKDSFGAAIYCDMNRPI